MALKIGLNGFGRIGRYLVRLLHNDSKFEIAVINARASNEDLARLLKYDSVHGTCTFDVGYDDNGLVIGGKSVPVTRNAPADWNWGAYGCDMVVESTGKFVDRQSCEKHLATGVKKVVISAPGKDADVTIVTGVNSGDYDPAKHCIISNASCTTNCLAPVAKLVNDGFGIKHGLMTTIHAYTMSQRILDGSHKDPRRARAACMSMIPTTTGAARAVTMVIPELKGKLDGMAVRVPTPDVSIVDLVLELEKPTTTEELNDMLRKNANEHMGFSDEPLVSIDYTGDTHGGVIDGLTTSVINGTMAKLLIWYDNEAGFTNQLVRLIRLVGKDI
ncbi:type I glyceraldehyde-3-phosphate dehydrogenase [Desulfovibrio inopinatus]|uniref:type I glyceraldehyde-3-phosphate dehydrogenase n=1 Tax=Desulfovibrio inopinatus TaxID=102109 RepID=UPI000428FC8B|nr:type I glyceraldehyde-3-phosphate dehydrogenase [Desulfovibrio inopinatus]